jgi:hypothetical protein
LALPLEILAFMLTLDWWMSNEKLDLWRKFPGKAMISPSFFFLRKFWFFGPSYADHTVFNLSAPQFDFYLLKLVRKKKALKLKNFCRRI